MISQSAHFDRAFNRMVQTYVEHKKQPSGILAWASRITRTCLQALNILPVPVNPIETEFRHSKEAFLQKLKEGSTFTKIFIKLDAGYEELSVRKSSLKEISQEIDTLVKNTKLIEKAQKFDIQWISVQTFESQTEAEYIQFHEGPTGFGETQQHCQDIHTAFDCYREFHSLAGVTHRRQSAAEVEYTKSEDKFLSHLIPDSKKTKIFIQLDQESIELEVDSSDIRTIKTKIHEQIRNAELIEQAIHPSIKWGAVQKRREKGCYRTIFYTHNAGIKPAWCCSCISALVGRKRALDDYNIFKSKKSEGV